jgi:CheY-like chemotaxis protein
MDVAMPVLDGIEATRLIKSIRASRDTRVIAYTANPSTAEPLVHELFVAVLPKPSAPDDVVATVRNVVNL